MILNQELSLQGKILLGFFRIAVQESSAGNRLELVFSMKNSPEIQTFISFSFSVNFHIVIYNKLRVRIMFVLQLK